MELPDEPEADGEVDNDQYPVAGDQHEAQDHQLQPQLGNVPEIESATAFLGIEIIALQIYKKGATLELLTRKIYALCIQLT